MSALLDEFYAGLKRASDRRKFLHDVYRQLVVSNAGKQTNGFFRSQLANIGLSPEAYEFLSHLAGQLYHHGFQRHSEILAEQLEMTLGEYWKGLTLAGLDKIDGDWRNYATLHVDKNLGMQIDVGGYQQRIQNSSSIILKTVSYGHESNLYELRFNNSEEVHGWLQLDKAMMLARTALKRPETLDGILAKSVN